jgi:two-component system OmpR family response regulator
MPDVSTGAARRSVLIVEDEASIRELLRLHLTLAGYDVEEVGDGTLGLERARAAKFDLIVLDVMLPGLDGITICRAIRSQGVNAETAIMMLTARETESDAVLGLESGADDYVAKPFGIRELVARAAAVLRRTDRTDARANASAPGVQSRDLRLDTDRRRAIVRGAAVELTKQEFDLLHLLAARRGIVFSRAALLAKVWSGDTYVTERTVDTVVSRLRRKIERDPQDPELILTAWGVGYKFVDAE